ncbi:FlxA protein [Enterobacter cloacae]|nr:FlxA protein [Enterobacter cloacae]
MTTLKPVSLSAMEIGSVDNSSGGNDIASQITRLTKQITKVTQQLKEVAMGDATAEEKQKQQELLESQLAMLPD